MHLRVDALTQAGWLKLAKAHALKNPYPTKNILYSLPVLRDLNGAIIAAPHLQLPIATTVQCTVRFKHQDGAALVC